MTGMAAGVAAIDGDRGPNGCGRIYDDITMTVGNTPIIRLPRLTEQEQLRAEILLKLEFFNPLANVKDRIAVAMLDALEREGRLNPGGVVIEPTSGSTGVSLAFVCASRGYRLILVMPDSCSLERQKMFRHLGAELVLTPGIEGMRGAATRAFELADDISNAIIPDQFSNPANLQAHEETTGREILADVGGRLDVLVTGVGTGGTLAGCARLLKRHIPDLQVIAVEPDGSQVLEGGQPGTHKIQGIGVGFIPSIFASTLMSGSVIDEVLRVSDEEAFGVSRWLARKEGVPGGISTGANVAAAVEVARRPEMAGKRILTFAPSFAERYLSTELFNTPEAQQASM